MINDTQVVSALKKYWGYDAFRPKQEEIVRNILDGRDVCVVMPTGGGKSLCYQLPALLQSGKTAIVVSPLIALMQDQVAQLDQMGISAAVLNSGQSWNEQRETERRAEAGEFRLLYLSPERLAKQEMLEWLTKVPISFFAIDEAHCISEWGHEFRPDYRQMKVLRKEFPQKPIAAFTASATRHVRHDIIEQLNLNDPGKFIASFHRGNLNYRVVACNSATQQAQLLAILRKHEGESAIVYSPTKNKVGEIVKRLEEEGIAAVGYHAGMGAAERRENQERWMNDEADVLVGTIAFGLGINKGPVRAVIHMSLPKSIEQYYQEAGRAGRDGNPSDCFLLWQIQDQFLIKHFIRKMTDEDEKRRSQERFWQIQRFVESWKCRHKQICEHFGESVRWENCGACDVCVRAADSSAAALAAVPAPRVNPRRKNQTPSGGSLDSKSKKPKKPRAARRDVDEDLLAALKKWRAERARTDKVPAFVIFHDSTLEHLCVRKPASLSQLRAVPGIGEAKLVRYGREILELLRGQ
jgi:ATP-dependent DNA helicase RecQ